MYFDRSGSGWFWLNREKLNYLSLCNQTQAFVVFQMNVITTNEREEINDLIYDAAKIINKAYETKGGWYSNANINKLKEKIKQIKYVLYNNDIAAIAVFEDRLGGLKCTGIAGNLKLNKEIYSESVKSIMKEIIDLDNNTYWIEASEAIEHYCKKFGGNPIPAAFVQCEINTKVSSCDYDTFHYQRFIGTDKTLCTKCMFGFKDEETRNKVIDYLNSVSGIDYETFKRSVNENMLEIDSIIQQIDELFWDYDVNELTVDMKNVLIQGLHSNNKYIKNISSELLDKMELILMKEI